MRKRVKVGMVYGHVGGGIFTSDSPCTEALVLDIQVSVYLLRRRTRSEIR